MEWYLHLRSQVGQKAIIQRRSKTNNPLGGKNDSVVTARNNGGACTIPQRAISRLVDQAIFGVANSALICPASYLEPLDRMSRRVLDGDASWLRPGASSSSTVSVVVLPLYSASSRMMATASASLPMPERKRGLSKRVKTKKRRPQRKRVSPPSTKRRYLHPMFWDLSQFSAVVQEKLAISGHATCTRRIGGSERKK